MHGTCVQAVPDKCAANWFIYKKKRSKYAVKYENIFVISASQSLFIFSLKQTYWLSSLARKSRLASTFFAEANKWPTYKAQMMPELLLHEKEKLRESLTTLLKSHIKQVILFCDHKDLVTIMNEVGNHELKLNLRALFHEDPKKCCCQVNSKGELLGRQPDTTEPVSVT